MSLDHTYTLITMVPSLFVMIVNAVVCVGCAVAAVIVGGVVVEKGTAPVLIKKHSLVVRHKVTINYFLFC